MKVFQEEKIVIISQLMAILKILKPELLWLFYKQRKLIINLYKFLRKRINRPQGLL
jgi:hypothetical protein